MNETIYRCGVVEVNSGEVQIHVWMASKTETAPKAGSQL